LTETNETEPQAPKKKKGSEKSQLQSFTVRVETSVKTKLDSVGDRTGGSKTSKVARHYLKLAELFALDNTRMEGWDSRELALVPTEIFRDLIKLAGTDENAQIDVGNMLGRYLKNLFYLYPRETVTEKMELVRRLGWFNAKRDPITGHALIPSSFAPDNTIQAMVYNIACKKEMKKPPPHPGEKPTKDAKQKWEQYWTEIRNDKMEARKNLETEIGFDALIFEP